ncbi:MULTISPECIES: alpha/beta hydrolase [unclassified Oleiphilus]|jgi:lysophospholipase|uniref:alpha/beta hydrolase n=2 Tax=Oleiphilus TaxID=141450 RepID=UPI0007C25FE6|nr:MULTISPECIES: alpha/beta hydrolase [unclassified Oleiphilus]KZY76648.1 hydrolase [Oleiphilus sp. HI0068]KZY81462.1 hydrolase [Oleiphilus sp. HI0069]KZZ34887.1 hydrolase [Oleiphilus sp. HI0117]KZZ35138.1 hydrolase [Oleiphilus sp. HI0086]KZZ75900.1 hydrolase [Oleiphilus sp. HI0132]
MTSPFDQQHIQQHWQPLNWRAFDPLDEASQRYIRYYGLDFADALPALSHGFGYFDAAGHRVSVHAWRPENPRGTVLVCHGYFDHVGLYRHIIGHVLSLGYAVLAYDLPGHGLSSGARAVIDDFRTYREVMENCLALAENHLPKPWHVIAQSTGGAIVMDYLLSFSPEKTFPFERAILLAPLVRPFRWPFVKWLHTAISPFAKQIKRVFSINSGDSEFLDFLENHDPLQPRHVPAQWVGALKKWLPHFLKNSPVTFSPVVIQGDSDETVDWRFNLSVIREKFTDPQIHMLTGARHHLANEHSNYRKEIFAIIDRYLA